VNNVAHLPGSVVDWDVGPIVEVQAGGEVGLQIEREVALVPRAILLWRPDEASNE